ncbi:unnamed protein product [Larinioides sclopetarius]
MVALKKHPGHSMPNHPGVDTQGNQFLMKLVPGGKDFLILRGTKKVYTVNSILTNLSPALLIV